MVGVQQWAVLKIDASRVNVWNVRILVFEKFCFASKLDPSVNHDS